jgi:hypothetical protein
VRAAPALLFLGVCSAQELAHAQERPFDYRPPREEQERTESSEGKEPEHRNDLTVVPYGGADSDIGVGGGIIGSFAHLTGRHEPYFWRIESVSLVTVKTDPKLEFPYIDSYLLLSLPHAVKDRLKLDVRMSYTRELALKYYGIGNATEVPDDLSLGDPRFEYAREHPTFRLRGETRLIGGTLLIIGFAYTHNWLEVPPDSLLAEQRASDNDRLRRMLGPTGEHGVAEFSYGLGWDNRDNPVSPTSGHYHTARIDLAPGGSREFPNRWARINAALRVFAPLVTRRLTLAMRGVGDILLGDPPFYELSKYDDTSALGGAKGVRGVPAHRYQGKLKIFGNFELRTRLVDFSLFGQRNSFGFVAFADTGRLWSDYPPDSGFDGDAASGVPKPEEALGLKLGLGGGLRLVGGRSFVVRADAAWSPDARPIGAYLGAGEVF